MSNFHFQGADPGRSKDGQGNWETKIDIECQAKRSSSKECLKRFKTLDDGQRKSFIEGMMDELRDKELEILSGTFGRKSSEDLKKEASIRKIYRN